MRKTIITSRQNVEISIEIFDIYTRKIDEFLVVVPQAMVTIYDMRIITL